MDKGERKFPTLELTLDPQSSLNACQPTLEIQSPKTPTLSRKLKAVSLDSEPKQALEPARDVFSMPNTPKRQIKHKLSHDFDEPATRSRLAPTFATNLKKFASNNSISGSQTLKTLPEIMTLHDFGDARSEPVRMRAKGLLERRGSNASLTIDLGSNSSIAERPPAAPARLNSAKSVSNLNLSAFGRRPAQPDPCHACIIYESVPNKHNCTKIKCLPSTKPTAKRCNCWSSSTLKCRRKSLSNENLYIPPCGFCQQGAYKDCTTKLCSKGNRKTVYPRQPELETTTQLSDDFKLHLQSVQYLQTAGSVLSISELRQACELARVPKLHAEFWEVPLNLQEKCYVSGSQSRNRYKGVLPNEHSRVHLPTTQSYIHANYIKGPDYTETAYIATQGPMAHTCLDFWEMVWHTNSNSIVMLTNLVEKGRSKCELYFPLGRKSHQAGKSLFFVKTTRERDKFTFDRVPNQSENGGAISFDEEVFEFEEVDELEYGPYLIRHVGEEALDECVIRQLELVRREGAAETSRTLRHYWFAAWQDHKMANPERLLRMALHLLGAQGGAPPQPLDAHRGGRTVERRKSGEVGARATPVVVHCSAGIGRTGCFLAILNGIQQLNANLNVDVLAILCSLRLNRGGMVQTAEQYELIHRVLNLYVDLIKV